MPNTEESILETNGIPEIEMEMEVSGMTQAPVDKSLTMADMAADAKAVGDRFADDEADLSSVINDVAAIKQWTGENIKVNSQQDAKTVAQLAEDVDTISKYTGEDIKIDDDQDAKTIAEALDDIDKKTGEDIKLDDTVSAPTLKEAIQSAMDVQWPVGSMFITVSETLPAAIAAIGTWVEVAIPLTYGDIRKGTRSYEEPESGFEFGTIHFWMRTE